MIKSFKDKETELIFFEEFSLKLAHDIQKTAMKKLWIIHSALCLKDLAMPTSNCLKKLKGDLAGKYSIRINSQWRICFIWQEEDAYEVEIIDYH